MFIFYWQFTMFKSVSLPVFDWLVKKLLKSIVMCKGVFSLLGTLADSFTPLKSICLNYIVHRLSNTNALNNASPHDRK